MTTMRLSPSGETVLIPPQLPTYLSDVHSLRRVVGKPTDEDVKAIHAVIRAQNTMAYLPTFHNPDLSMQLSQHLFGAQLAIYRANYSMTLLPGERNVYTPPTLPSHIPGTLHEVIGAPSNEEIKTVQGAARSLENLANNPHLFDADLSMSLSQHMFNIQFARYMHDSSEGNFMSETQPDEPSPAILQPSHEIPEEHLAPPDAHGLHGSGQNVVSGPEDNQEPQRPSEIAELGETMKAVHSSTNDSKEVLEKISRLLTLIQDHQCSVAAMDKYYHIYKNPLNREGVSAMEYGLPQLRYGYYQDGLKYRIFHRDEIMARYLKFFGIGADLVQGDENPKLISGQYGEAEKLILKEIGIGPYY